MGKIEFTNIIIDDFSLAQKDNSRTYIHVLSHIHTGTRHLKQTISKDYPTDGTMDPSTAPKSPRIYSISNTPA